MAATVKLDDLDKRILNVLIRDARTKLKDIASECGTSSVVVLSRIKRLKEAKVLTGGATFFSNLAPLCLTIIATIGIVFDGKQDDRIFDLIAMETHLVEPSVSIGEYDLCALVFAENVAKLDKIAFSLRERFGARKVFINVWSGIPQDNYGNVDLQPVEKR